MAKRLSRRASAALFRKAETRRKSLGFTWNTLAKACGVTPQTLFRFKRGDRNPTQEFAEKLAVACGFTLRGKLDDARDSALKAMRVALSKAVVDENTLDIIGLTELGAKILRLCHIMMPEEKFDISVWDDLEDGPKLTITHKTEATGKPGYLNIFQKPIAVQCGGVSNSKQPRIFFKGELTGKNVYFSLGRIKGWANRSEAKEATFYRQQS